METESRITSAIRLVVMIGVGLVLGIGGLYWLGREMAGWLGFEERVQGTAGAGAVVLSIIASLIVGFSKLVRTSDGVESAKQEPPAKQASELHDVRIERDQARNELSERHRDMAAPLGPGAIGQWHHRVSSEPEVDVWYEVYRRGGRGIYHTAKPMTPFTGVVKTKTSALLYIKNGKFPKDGALWMVPDESKFVSVLERLPRDTSRQYLVELSDGKRICCRRNFASFWETEDGTDRSIFDDAKKVSRWLELSTKKADSLKKAVERL